MSLSLSRSWLLGLVVVLSTACQPSYPQCQDDGECYAPDRYEYCLNGTCAQCRDDSHCDRRFDERYVCESGTCVTIAGYCRDGVFPCPDGMVCRDQRCGPKCVTDLDCPRRLDCRDGRCAPTCGCAADQDCPAGTVCQNCVCLHPPRPVSFLSPIGFPVGWAEPDADGEAMIANAAHDLIQLRADRGVGFLEVGCQVPAGGHPAPVELARMRFEVIRQILGDFRVSPEDVVRVAPTDVYFHEKFDLDGDDWCGINFEWTLARPVTFEHEASTLTADEDSGLRRTGAAFGRWRRPVALGVGCAAPGASPELNAARRTFVVDTLLDAGVPPHGILLSEDTPNTRYDCTVEWLVRESP